MGVGVQGKAGLGVAQNAGEGLGIHPGGQGVGSERVPQIMEPKAGQSSLLQQFFEPAVCTAGIYRPLRSERVRKDPLGQSRCPPFLQKLGGAVRKQNCPLSRIGLGFSCLQPSALSCVDRSPHLEGACLTVEVVPCQAAQLSPTQAGSQLRVEEVMPDGVESNCAQELLHLVMRKYPLGCVLYSGRGYFLSGIEGNQALVRCCFQGVVEGGVDSPDGGRSQPRPTVLAGEFAPSFQEKLIQFPQVIRCQFYQ